MALVTTSYGEDIFGSGVALAARLESAGEPGEIIVSEATWRVLEGTPGISLTFGGDLTLKGMDSVRFFKIAHSVEDIK